MNCKTCGKELRKDASFCSECGTKVTPITSEAKTTETKAKTETKTTTTETTNVPISNSKATASLVLGIISLVICAPLLMFLSITGLILGIAQKGKNGIKTAGIIINAIAIGLGVLFWLLFTIFIIAVYQSENGGGHYESTQDSNGSIDIIDYDEYDDMDELNDYFEGIDFN